MLITGMNTHLKADGVMERFWNDRFRERLAKYFEGLNNASPPAEKLVGGDLRTLVALDPPIREAPPSYQESFLN